MTVRRYDLLDLRRELAARRSRKRRLAGGYSFGYGAAAAAASSGGTNFEALVQAFSLRVWSRANYTGIGGSWGGSASAGSSGSTVLADAINAPGTASALGFTIANFNGTASRLNASATSNYVSASAQYGWALINIDAIDTNDGSWALNDPICITSGTGQWGVILRNASGTLTVEHRLFTGAVDRVASTTITTGTWHLVQWKNNGTTISIRLNSNSWVDSTGGAVSSLAANLAVGGWSAGPHFDGGMAEIALTETALSNGNFDTVVAYVNQRYGLTL